MQQTSASVPRRWNVEIDGIKWIPRMIDKARMTRSGVLGNYLMGHSPVDASMLRALGMTTNAWVDLVAGTTTDEEVMAKLRAHGMDETKMRAWSDRFESRFKAYIPLWDLDEGYVTPTRRQKIGMAIFKPLEGVLMRLVRIVRPAP